MDNYNEIISESTQKIMDIIYRGDRDEGIEEDYITMYDAVFEIVENAASDDEFDSDFFNMIGLSNEEIGDILDILININDEGHRNPLTEDYEVTYAKKSVSLEDIQDKQEIRKPLTQKSKIKGTPHFEYNDGEKKTIGVGKRDYNVKYGKGGPLFEDDENGPIYTKSGKLIERRTQRKISPALKEAFSQFEKSNKLLESGIINKNDIDLLNENEHYDNFSEGDMVKTSDGWKGRIVSQGEDDQGIFYEVKALYPSDDGVDSNFECYGPEDLTYIGGPEDDDPYMSYDEFED